MELAHASIGHEDVQSTPFLNCNTDERGTSLRKGDVSRSKEQILVDRV